MLSLFSFELPFYHDVFDFASAVYVGGVENKVY